LVVADVRLDPHLGVDEAVRADHEILVIVDVTAAAGQLRSLPAVLA